MACYPTNHAPEQTDEREPEKCGALASLGNVNSRPRYPCRYATLHAMSSFDDFQRRIDRRCGLAAMAARSSAPLSSIATTTVLVVARSMLTSRASRASGIEIGRCGTSPFRSTVAGRTMSLSLPCREARIGRSTSTLRSSLEIDDVAWQFAAVAAPAKRAVVALPSAACILRAIRFHSECEQRSIFVRP